MIQRWTIEVFENSPFSLILISFYPELVRVYPCKEIEEIGEIGEIEKIGEIGEIGEIPCHSERRFIAVEESRSP